MTSDLFIIGDSFSKYKPDSIYLNLLASDFNIKNFSKNGVGPQYIIESLQNLSIEKSDFLFIVFPDPNRIHFKYIDDYDASKIFQLWRKSTYENIFLNQKEQKIVSDYDVLRKSNLLELLPSLYLTYILSFYELYDKILIWPTNNMTFDLIQTIPENCFIVKKPLNHISIDENVFVKNEKIFLKDLRINHLSEVNHHILYDFIKNFFIDNKRELPIFKRDLNV